MKPSDAPGAIGKCEISLPGFLATIVAFAFSESPYPSLLTTPAAELGMTIAHLAGSSRRLRMRD